MKDESKYYTPEPEEFHMRFEYEISTREGAWLKDTYMCNSKVGVTFDDMPELAKISRVKLLDRSDIEDLGFGYDEGSSGHYSFLKEIWDGDNSEEYKICYMFEDNPTSVVILKADKAWVMGTSRWKPIFKGTIKNKSKLKDVLKMIGI